MNAPDQPASSSPQRSAPSLAAILLSLLVAVSAYLVAPYATQLCSYLTGAALAAFNIEGTPAAIFATVCSVAWFIACAGLLIYFERRFDGWPGAFVYQFPVFIFMVASNDRETYRALLSSETATTYDQLNNMIGIAALAVLVCIILMSIIRRGKQELPS